MVYERRHMISFFACYNSQRASLPIPFLKHQAHECFADFTASSLSRITGHARLSRSRLWRVSLLRLLGCCDVSRRWFISAPQLLIMLSRYAAAFWAPRRLETRWLTYFIAQREEQYKAIQMPHIEPLVTAYFFCCFSFLASISGLAAAFHRLLASMRHYYWDAKADGPHHTSITSFSRRLRYCFSSPYFTPASNFKHT